MKDSWQLTATRTIDLGYEQLLILEGERGTRVKLLFRGVWLGEKVDPQRCVRNREADVARGARNRPVVDLLGGARVAMDEPTRRWRLQW